MQPGIKICTIKICTKKIKILTPAKPYTVYTYRACLIHTMYKEMPYSNR